VGKRPVGSRLSAVLARLILVAALIAGLIVGGTCFRVWQVARVDNRDNADVVVVLGAAQYHGEPSAVLSARLDHAAALWRDGVAPKIVTVGGRLAGDTYTEAEAGEKYLTSYGVPQDAVVPIGEGNDTLESVRAVAVRAETEGWNTAVIVSDPWHSLRARTMAQDSGLDVWTSPTRTGPVVQTRETEARYIARESAALLYYRFTGSSADSLGTDLD